MTEARRVCRRGVLVVVLLVAGCGEAPRQGLAADSLSRRERDSIIANSKLPGAPAVRRALEVSDTLASRADRINTGGR